MHWIIWKACVDMDLKIKTTVRRKFAAQSSSHTLGYKLRGVGGKD